MTNREKLQLRYDICCNQLKQLNEKLRHYQGQKNAPKERIEETKDSIKDRMKMANTFAETLGVKDARNISMARPDALQHQHRDTWLQS